MSVAVLICTHGDERWSRLAASHASPSIDGQGADEQVVAHDVEASLAGCRNDAVEGAQADWLCFVDADDQLDAGYLDAMRAAMRHWNLARRGDLRLNPLLLVPHVQYVVDGRRVGWPRLPAPGRPVGEVNCAVIGTLVPRHLFLEVGGFREWPLYEDWELWLRCLRAGARPVAVPDAVYLADGSPGRNQGPDSRSTYDRIRREHAPHVRDLRWPD